MKKRTLGFLTLTAVGFTAFAQTTEPVIMTINGKPVYKSEFENVYKKNSGKEVNKEQKSVKEYVDLFSTFKMKVFEAEANGLDTNSSFKTELAGYRKQLAAPYLTDKNVNDALLQEAYDRMKTEIKASHILIRVAEDALPKDTIEAYTRLMIIRDALTGKNPTPAKLTEYENLLKKSAGLTKSSTHQDSVNYNSKLSAVRGITSALSSGGDKFAAVAKKTSEDPSAAENGGDLGYFTSLQMVYPFETAAFKTNVGDITMPVRTRFGYHILKVNDKRPSQGEILTAHIMVKFSKDMGEKDKANLKTKIDEIYTKLKAGEKFEDLARQFSDDKPSAEKGGQLQWFGSSRMPIEFEKAAFALENNGDYSAPFTTTYGWHIVKRLDKKGLASFADMKGDLKQRIGKDSRTQAGKTSLIEKIKKENNFKENAVAKKEFLKVIDSTVFQGRWEAKKAEKLGKKELFSLFNKEKAAVIIFTQADFAKYIETHQTARPKTDFSMFLNQSYKEFVDETLINYEDGNLESKYPEFRNLLKEYRDGILLFDLTDQKVWSKAVKDTAGLKAFYEQNKNNYLWDERADVTMYKCANDKVAKEVRGMLKKNKSEKEITETINKTSQLNVSVENITYLKGENKDVDANWKQGVVATDIKDTKENKVTVLVVNKVMGKTPKTIAEAKGMITADYQNYLEKEWLAYLKNKYTVKVNEDVLNTVK
ncbi:MAG: PpiC-type peptidyl-prolyl cis-trans isomerase [Bacteroidetes bacterium]|jgi:peptidyl-prolyl cis-trans isomerase SurA|nr:PpiC-type peptidyl-prolyl cis-trans isomerase [Bacteroidota bacterium]